MRPNCLNRKSNESANGSENGSERVRRRRHGHLHVPRPSPIAMVLGRTVDRQMPEGNRRHALG